MTFDLQRPDPATMDARMFEAVAKAYIAGRESAQEEIEQQRQMILSLSEKLATVAEHLGRLSEKKERRHYGPDGNK